MSQDPFVTRWRGGKDGQRPTNDAIPLDQPPASEAPTLPPRDFEMTTPNAAAPPPPFQVPGKFGRYQLQKLLGQGGMGAVYLARDTQLDRLVALKIPTFSSHDGSQGKQRFLREARAAATVQHANICPVFDIGEIDGTPFLTMGYIEGKPLSDVLAAGRKRLPEREAAMLVRKLALALEEAHQKKVIHRDLKPANVMLNARAEPIIMDFGLARRGNKTPGRPTLGETILPIPFGGGETAANLTQFGDIMGTPAYMAPEQANGNPDDVGPGCDVYSLGVILYELLTGRVPFQGDMTAVLVQLVKDAPKPPSKYRDGLDEDLEAICLRALAKKPAGRYRSMAEFALALTEYLKGTAAAAVSGSSPKVQVVEAVPEPPKPKRPKRAPRPKKQGVPAWVWLVTAGAAVLFLGLMTFLLTRPTGGTLRVELGDADAPFEFRIDGQPVALSAENPTLRLPAGAHRMEVTAFGYKPFEKEFQVERGETLNIPVKLEPKPPVAVIAPSAPELKPLEPKGVGPRPIEQPKTTEKTGDLAWPRQALEAGEILSPDVSGITPWGVDTFKNPRSGFPTGANTGYQGGAYVLDTKTTPRVVAKVPMDKLVPANPTGEWFCYLHGRVQGTESRWGLEVTQREGTGTLRVVVQNPGVVLAGEDKGSLKPVQPGAGKHPAIAAGAGSDNRLLVVVRRRHVEIYVNGKAVCDPMPVTHDFTAANLSLLCARGGAKTARAEFAEFRIGPAAEISGVGERGAKPGGK